MNTEKDISDKTFAILILSSLIVMGVFGYIIYKGQNHAQQPPTIFPSPNGNYNQTYTTIGSCTYIHYPLNSSLSITKYWC